MQGRKGREAREEGRRGTEGGRETDGLAQMKGGASGVHVSGLLNAPEGSIGIEKLARMLESVPNFTALNDT